VVNELPPSADDGIAVAAVVHGEQLSAHARPPARTVRRSVAPFAGTARRAGFGGFVVDVLHRVELPRRGWFAAYDQVTAKRHYLGDFRDLEND
jgi:hypothetical protein